MNKPVVTRYTAAGVAEATAADPDAFGFAWIKADDVAAAFTSLMAERDEARAEVARLTRENDLLRVSLKAADEDRFASRARAEKAEAQVDAVTALCEEEDARGSRWVVARIRAALATGAES